MFDLLKNYFNQNISISQDEWEEIIKNIQLQFIKKNEFIQLHNSKWKHEIFVFKGSFKIFTINENGNENIINFAFEGDWINNLNCFELFELSTYNIVSLEDSQVFIITRENKNKLIQKIPKLKSINDLLLKKNFLMMNERILDFLNKTAKQRYIEFIKKHPTKAKIISNKDLSSYLGISFEFLSKIKKKTHLDTLKNDLKVKI